MYTRICCLIIAWNFIHYDFDIPSTIRRVVWQKLISSSVSIHAPATFAVCIQHLQCSFTLPSLEFCVRSVLACHCLPTQPSTHSLCWECCSSNTFLSFGKGSWMLPFLSSVKLFDEIGIKDLLHNLHKCWNLNYFLGQSSTTLGSSSPFIIGFKTCLFEIIFHDRIVSNPLPIWILSCCFKLLECANFLSHIEQLNGFSPVWILSWILNFPDSLNDLSHFEQLNGFSSVWILSWVLKALGSEHL